MAIADTLARLVEKSLVTVEDGGGRPTACSRPCGCTRAGGSRTQARPPRSPSAMHAGRSRSPQRRRTSPRLDRDAANLRAALDLLLAARPPYGARPLRRPVAVLAASHRAGRSEAPLRRRARSRSGTDASTRRGAPRGGRNRLSRRRARTRDGARRGESCRRPRDRRRAIPVAGSAVPRRGRCGRRRHRRRHSGAGAGLALARSERFAPAEALGIHSLGVVRWMRGDLASADRLLAESVEAFRALEHSPETVPSPLNIAEIRTSLPEAAPGCSTCSRTR